MRFSRHLARFVFVVCLFPAVHPVRAQSIDTPAVDALVEEARKAWAVPGAAVAIVKDGQVVHLKGYGVREQGKSDPVTPDTIFNIGSTGKSFTALAVAILADEGKLSWDDRQVGETANRVEGLGLQEQALVAIGHLEQA